MSDRATAATTDEFAANIPDLNSVPFDAPWLWLAAGWRDMWEVPGISLTFGVAFTLISSTVLVGLYLIGWESLILPLAGGFLLIGPMMAVGLYETSRRLQAGESVTLKDALFAGVGAPGQLAFMGAGLLIVYFVWVEIALLLFMLFFGPEAFQLSGFIPALLLTPTGLGLLIAGTAAGAVLALTVFSLTVVSIPLLMDREIDVATAVLTSVQAVLHNPKAMALWAGLIAAMMIGAFAVLFLGLVVVFPLVGHATWHAYKAVVKPQKRAQPKQGRS